MLLLLEACVDCDGECECDDGSVENVEVRDAIEILDEVRLQLMDSVLLFLALK